MSDARVIAELPKNRRETLRVALDRFKGYDLVTLRAWARDPDKGNIPTRAGLAVSVELLPQLLAMLKEAEREARLVGLLSPESGDG